MMNENTNSLITKKMTKDGEKSSARAKPQAKPIGQGCYQAIYDKLMTYSTAVAITGIVFGAIQILGIWASCSLYRALGKYQVADNFNKRLIFDLNEAFSKISQMQFVDFHLSW
ncbi:hypothetical protein CAPTEDRAFT_187108 [Capitella teleta]|uniref:Uncharacterized protein n=1 Tax=Capitella teleta TaxID=283909 RepID=R7VAK3_CAPTE|nr:hypothetical protein CAPTEDRAFT_187108 [Capitella teleta]|eukprot:ELU15634.1 hypothetical protein CAPTEDRAFT_187108 [Capitella teleta]